MLVPEVFAYSVGLLHALPHQVLFPWVAFASSQGRNLDPENPERVPSVVTAPLAGTAIGSHVGGDGNLGRSAVKGCRAGRVGVVDAASSGGHGTVSLNRRKPTRQGPPARPQARSPGLAIPTAPRALPEPSSVAPTVAPEVAQSGLTQSNWVHSTPSQNPPISPQIEPSSAILWEGQLRLFGVRFPAPPPCSEFPGNPSLRLLIALPGLRQASVQSRSIPGAS